MLKLPVVSIIVTTFNSGNFIRNCLASIHMQTYPTGKLEVIIVDNHSRDATIKTITEFQKSHGDQKIRIAKAGPERSAQRNCGGKMAKGKYLFFLDSDMRLSPEAIGECAKKIEQAPLAGLYIPEIVLGKGFWGKVRNFERSFYNATVIDAVRFVPKEIFEELGGFDEGLTGPEDWDFDKRIRRLGKVDIIQAPLYHDETGFNLADYIAKKNYYSRSFAAYKKKWGMDDPDLKKQFGFVYRYFGVFTEKGKWRKLLMNPVLSSGILILRLLVGWNYLASQK